MASLKIAQASYDDTELHNIIRRIVTSIIEYTKPICNRDGDRQGEDEDPKIVEKEVENDWLLVKQLYKSEVKSLKNQIKEWGKHHTCSRVFIGHMREIEKKMRRKKLKTGENFRGRQENSMTTNSIYIKLRGWKMEI